MSTLFPARTSVSLMKQQLLPIGLYAQSGCNARLTLDRMIAMEKWAVMETLIQHQQHT